MQFYLYSDHGSNLNEPHTSGVNEHFIMSVWTSAISVCLKPHTLYAYTPNSIVDEVLCICSLVPRYFCTYNHNMYCISLTHSTVAEVRWQQQQERRINVG